MRSHTLSGRLGGQINRVPQAPGEFINLETEGKKMNTLVLHDETDGRCKHNWRDLVDSVYFCDHCLFLSYAQTNLLRGFLDLDIIILSKGEKNNESGDFVAA